MVLCCDVQSGRASSLSVSLHGVTDIVSGAPLQRWSLTQVLSLGFARDMIAWAVKWLHAVCAGGPAACGIEPWTLMAACLCANLFGRRPSVSTAFFGYMYFLAECT